MGSEQPPRESRLDAMQTVAASVPLRLLEQRGDVSEQCLTDAWPSSHVVTYGVSRHFQSGPRHVADHFDRTGPVRQYAACTDGALEAHHRRTRRATAAHHYNQRVQPAERKIRVAYSLVLKHNYLLLLELHRLPVAQQLSAILRR
jgi:hypothetical protein